MYGYEETTKRVSETFSMSSQKYQSLKKSVEDFNRGKKWKKKAKFDSFFRNLYNKSSHVKIYINVRVQA